MNYPQDLSAAVKSIVNGSRPVGDSISLDISSVSDVDTLLTYALTTRSLDQAASAFERVLELDSDNEVANAGFTWLLGVRDAAERLEQAGVSEAGDESNEDAQAEDAASVNCDDSLEAYGSSRLADSGDSGFSAALPFAFQQVVEPIIASNGQADSSKDSVESCTKAEEEEKARAEAEAAAKAEEEEKERAEAEAAAKAEEEEKARAEAEAAAKAEEEEKERAEAESAAKAEEEEKAQAEAAAAAKAEEEEKERAEAEAAAKAEEEEKERAEAEACLLYTSPSPRDRQKSRMPSSA